MPFPATAKIKPYDKKSEFAGLNPPTHWLKHPMQTT
jgi:hypothetical protein